MTPPAPEKASRLLEAVATVAILFSMLVSGMVAARETGVPPGEVIGAIIAAPLFLLVVIGVGRLFGMKSRRTRAKVALGIGILFAFGQCVQFAMPPEDQDVTSDSVPDTGR